jgi:hypothetical protein
MTIRANVVAIRDQIQAEINSPNKPITNKVKAKALQAINGGAYEWVEYMKIFALPEKPQELARLIPTDGTGGDGFEAMRDARAYLVAAGPCTPATVGNLEESVTDILDVGLQP